LNDIPPPSASSARRIAVADSQCNESNGISWAPLGCVADARLIDGREDNPLALLLPYLSPLQVRNELWCAHFSQVIFKVVQPKPIYRVVSLGIAGCVGLFVCGVHVNDKGVHGAIQPAAVVPLFDRHNGLLWIILGKQAGFVLGRSVQADVVMAWRSSVARKNRTFFPMEQGDAPL
jgi:hypothetical protein